MYLCECVYKDICISSNISKIKGLIIIYVERMDRSWSNGYALKSPLAQIFSSSYFLILYYCSMPMVWPFPKVPHRRSLSMIVNIFSSPKYYPNPWSNKKGIDLERYSPGVKSNASFAYHPRKLEGDICTLPSIHQHGENLNLPAISNQV